MPALRTLAAVCAAAMGTIVLPVAVHAQASSREMIELQLENADELADMQGFRLDDRALSSSSIVGLIEDDAGFMFAVDLEDGGQYLIEGFCDEDCTDMDLTLHGPDGAAVTHDTEVDDVPELRFRAPESGEFYVGVRMIDCSADRCYYAVRVLRK